MTTEPILSVRDVTSGYGDKALMEGLSFDVFPGEVVGVLGGSGSGKTTLMRHMIGLVPPLAGTICVDGIDIGRAQGAERQAALRKIGVMYQSGALFGSMTLLENVTLPLEVHTRLPPRAREMTARLKLALVALRGYEDYLPAEISGGMRKRAAIARAMALDPAILFLDEPSAGLDPITSADIDHLIVSLSQTLGITVVMVTHELASVFATNDRVILLDKQTRGILAEGPPRELLRSSDPRISRFFQRHAQTEHEP